MRAVHRSSSKTRTSRTTFYTRLIKVIYRLPVPILDPTALDGTATSLFHGSSQCPRCPAPRRNLCARWGADGARTECRDFARRCCTAKWSDLRSPWTARPCAPRCSCPLLCRAFRKPGSSGLGSMHESKCVWRGCTDRSRDVALHRRGMGSRPAPSGQRRSWCPSTALHDWLDWSDMDR